MLAHLLMTTTCGPRLLIVARRGEFMVQGPHIIGLILQPMFGAGPTSIDVDEICDRVHTLNESVQRQLEEAD